MKNQVGDILRHLVPAVASATTTLQGNNICKSIVPMKKVRCHVLLGTGICTHTLEWRELYSCPRLSHMRCSQTCMRYPCLPLPPAMQLFLARSDQSHRHRVRQRDERLECVLLVMLGVKASIRTCFALLHPHHDVRGIEQLPSVPSAPPHAMESNHACFGLPHPCHVPKGRRRLVHVPSVMTSVIMLTRPSSAQSYLRHARERTGQVLHVQSALPDITELTCPLSGLRYPHRDREGGRRLQHVHIAMPHGVVSTHPCPGQSHLHRGREESEKLRQIDVLMQNAVELTRAWCRLLHPRHARE